MMTRHATMALLALALLSAPADAQAPAPDPLQVTVVTDQADAVLAVAEKAARGEEPDSADWSRLWSSEGYVRLKARQAGMGRPMEDAEFRAFVLSPKLHRRLPALRGALEGWRRLDARAAAARAFAYLPAGTVVRAKVYPVVKPQTNSFVWELRTDPAIFMYLDPEVPPAAAENTTAHELHHVGYAAACPRAEAADPRVGLARAWMSGFGEGLAVLAAAGGPNVHPHATSGQAERAVWDRDVARFARDFSALESFFLDLLHGRAGDDAGTNERGMSFIVRDDVPQGPFYTVGWKLAATVERELGREALVAAICDPHALLRAYNDAAARANARGGQALPVWSPELVQGIRLP